MKRWRYNFFISIVVLFLILIINPNLMAQTGLDCATCHPNEHGIWMSSRHANTQDDVAEELAGEWAGLPPDSVIFGQDAENCIACHSPLAITANGGMTEVQALNYFFSTTNGVFTSTTQSLNSGEWPHVTCETCHQVPADHPLSLPTTAIFNSPTAQYDSVASSSALCGQCHGSLRFPDTDHRRFDAWHMSRHGHGGQADVAGELGEEFAGSTPTQVVADENCVACHAPTAVLANGGMSEADVLGHFFTTTGGVFTAGTVPTDTLNWPDVSCTACHNPMHPDSLWYFNSTTKAYQTLSSSQELCGQCHGNLRFPDTDHLSYNIASGTGGMGVPDTLTMPGIQCVDCHMHASDVDGSNSAMFGGHSWSVFIEEPDGSTTASCTSCHASISAALAETIVTTWQTEFAQLDSIAQIKVAQADTFLIGSSDSLKLQYLAEAHHNLEFAESDESGGVHNHNYVMSLVNDAIAKSDFILTGIAQPPSAIADRFDLYQNYPNPFNSQTTIPFHIAQAGHYSLKLYNVRGQVVKTILDKDLPISDYKIHLNANELSSGVYFYELSGNGRKVMKKLVLMK